MVSAGWRAQRAWARKDTARIAHNRTQPQPQDPADKSFIICDDTLKGLVGEARFKGFGCQKYLKVHILGPADDDAAGGGEEVGVSQFMH